MLELKDALDHLEGKLDRANAHWNLLMGLDLAVVGFLSARTSAIMLAYKIMLSAVLLLAYGFLLWAILRAQEEMILIDGEIKATIKAQQLTENRYAKHLLRRSFRRFPTMTIPVYLLLNSAVLALIWCGPI